MNFEISHTLRNITLAEYERLYFDETFNIALCRHLGLARELVKRDETATKIERQVRVGPDREIPAPIAKMLGGRRVEYVEHVSYTFGSNTAYWHTVPSFMADKIISSGTVLFREMPTGVVREVRGDIKVQIFGLGGVAERFIVADVERSYDKAAAFTQSWIDQGKARS
jgi:hypothetical protein